MRQFCLFGNHPKLSSLELETVFGHKPKKMIDQMGLFDASFDTQKAVETLGGVIKAGDVLWNGSEKDFSIELLTDWILKHPKKEKVLFGLSIISEDKKSALKFKHLPIKLKKELKDAGKKVRWVTGEHGSIRPVTIEKLKLIDEGYDFVLILHGKKVVLGITTAVQNATSWSERDYGRPFRDAKVGMLPPKLARMMTNLAVGKSAKKSEKLLDPFCGSGTVIMEAGLRFPNLQLIGSDIDSKQVRGAERNIQWMNKRGMKLLEEPTWIVSDVKDLNNQIHKSIQYIVTEGYLGRPLQGKESRHDLEMNMREVHELWSSALPVLASLQPKHGRLVCAWPEYHVGHETVWLNIEKEARQAGYKIFTKKPLLYGRPHQLVKRRIVVLEKIV